MMMCPEPVMDQATAFMTALTTTTNFLANKKILVLLAGEEIVATFVTDSQGLAGTSWDVINYNNGRQAVVGLLADTEISADFGEREITGNAGCNQYFAGYSVNGNAIDIGTPARTFRFCSEPAGVMDQETEFLIALESAATYSIEGDMLQMRTAEDELAVIMKRKAVVDLPAPKPTPKTPTGRVVGAQTLNIRSGPSTAFPVIGAARAGDEGEIVGRSADARWWAVSAPALPGGIGWVSADFVLATNAENVPVIQSPPPPTPRPPTPTPVPIARPTVQPIPPTPSPEISFWADRTNIAQGECATLNWSVNNVQAVWVYPVGQPYHRFPRTGQGSEVVCPTTTTTYEMRVLLRNGQTVFRQITINVAQPIAPPQPPPAAPPPAADPLAGTRWSVMNFNNGMGAVTGIVQGSTITMDFDAAGSVRGNAGCNTYSASYQAGGNTLSVNPPITTNMACESPAGVMQQEQQFLAALQSAATFQLTGNQLQIRSGGDALAIMANRAP